MKSQKKIFKNQNESEFEIESKKMKGKKPRGVRPLFTVRVGGCSGLVGLSEEIPGCRPQSEAGYSSLYISIGHGCPRIDSGCGSWTMVAVCEVGQHGVCLWSLISTTTPTSNEMT